MTIVLVTGGKGFIGTNLVRELLTIDYITEIRVLDSELYGKTTIDDTRVKYYLGDIRDKQILDTITQNVHTIFHLAAVISVPESHDNPQAYEDVNVIGTINVLDAAVKHNVKHFIFSSSCAVYGDKNGILRESSLVFNANSPYAISKLHAEEYCKFYKKTYGLNTIILRYFNVYGKDQDPNRPYASAVSSFLKNISNQEHFTIYGKGTQSRDFIHVTDIARINIHAMNNNLEGIYNVGTGTSININKLAKKMAPIQEIKYCSARAGDVQRIRCDNSKLLLTGFKFTYKTFDEGLKTLK